MAADQDEAWALVQDAILAFNAKVPDITRAREALATVIRKGAWKAYRPPLGKACAYTQFAEWVTAKVPRGLDTTIENIEKIAEGDEDLTDALNGVLLGHGGDRRSPAFKNDNVMLESDQGNARSYALRRLRKDRPDLHAQVLAGEVTANRAMVKAGFRPKTISVPVGRPERVAAYLRKHMPREALARLVELLTSEGE